MRQNFASFESPQNLPFLKPYVLVPLCVLYETHTLWETPVAQWVALLQWLQEEPLEKAFLEPKNVS